MTTANDAALVDTPLADPRLERLLTTAQQINDMLAKIQSASAFLASSPSHKEAEEVQLAKDELYRDLARDTEEARMLLPVVDEIAAKLQEQERNLETRRKMNSGLAKIEGLSGSDRQKMFFDAATDLQRRVAEIQNMVNALDALEKDLRSPKRVPVTCPRCASTKITYRITPSELGYTLYKCSECSNAWKITEFRLRLGSDQAP